MEIRADGRRANPLRQAVSIVCTLLAFQNLQSQTPAPTPQPASTTATPAAPTPADQQTERILPPDQLDSLVAPIALYPDPLLSQVLVASTYPLEVVECDRWLKQNPTLKGKDLSDAVSKQSWDASVQALVAFPDVLKNLDDNISWTTDLGNAFLNQQADVMDAVQRLRVKAQDSGKLQTTEQQKVTTQTDNNKTYVVIQPSNPEVIYVPSYNPTVIWGAPPIYYPYPAVYYPPVSTGAVIATAAISFGVGMAIGAMWSGGWGWGCGWGHSSVTINNTFIRTNNFNRTSVVNGNTWQHNAAHRAGVPYNNRDVANRYQGGANARANRPNAAQTQQRLGQENTRVGQGSGQNRGQGNRGENFGQNRSGQNNFGQNQGGADRVGNRPAGGGNFGNRGGSAFGDMNRGGGGARTNAYRGGASAGGMRGGGGRR